MKKLQILMCAVIVHFLAIQVKAQDNFSKESILTAYYGLKDALINSSSSVADVKAKELLTILTSFPVGRLTTSDKISWRKYIDKLQFDARHISESHDINHQREHFASLSENMYILVKMLKINTSTVYREYCPMKKAYWLSNSNAIKNPYYGIQMSSCGEVKNMLPAAK